VSKQVQAGHHLKRCGVRRQESIQRCVPARISGYGPCGWLLAAGCAADEVCRVHFQDLSGHGCDVRGTYTALALSFQVPGRILQGAVP
jgi:hypothetical protein